MAIWGSSFPAFKYALQHLDGWFIVWTRMVIASALTLLAWPLLRVRRLHREDLRWLAMLGLCEPCLYFIFETYALKLTSSSQAGVIVAMLPLIAAGAAGWFLKEVITRQLMLGMLCAVAGAIWMSLSSASTETSPNPLLGNLFEFGAMVCATGYIISVKKLSKRHGALFLVAVQCWTGALFFLPLAVFGGGLQDAFTADVPVEVWLIVLYLSTVVSLLAFFCYNYGLRFVPASRATVYGNLLPLFAVLLSMGFLGESFSLEQTAGCLLILVGLIITQRAPGSA